MVCGLIAYGSIDQRYHSRIMSSLKDFVVQFLHVVHEYGMCYRALGANNIVETRRVSGKFLKECGVKGMVRWMFFSVHKNVEFLTCSHRFCSNTEPHSYQNNHRQFVVFVRVLLSRCATKGPLFLHVRAYRYHVWKFAVANDFFV